METNSTKKTYRDYTVEEEWVNIITHGVGIFIGIAFFIIFLMKGWETRPAAYFITLSIYCASFIGTYASSTVYHSLYKASVKIKNRAHLIDHAAIYIFIAGTYTPIAYYYLPNTWRIVILSLVWFFALAGVVFKMYSIGRFTKLSTYLYLAMGWLIVIAAKPLLAYAPLNLIYLIVLGGVFYSLGTVFFLMNKLKYAHGIWHVLVLAGSLSHLAGIYLFI